MYASGHISPRNQLGTWMGIPLCKWFPTTALSPNNIYDTRPPWKKIYRSCAERTTNHWKTLKIKNRPSHYPSPSLATYHWYIYIYVCRKEWYYIYMCVCRPIQVLHVDPPLTCFCQSAELHVAPLPSGHQVAPGFDLREGRNGRATCCVSSASYLGWVVYPPCHQRMARWEIVELNGSELEHHRTKWWSFPCRIAEGWWQSKTRLFTCTSHSDQIGHRLPGVYHWVDHLIMVEIGGLSGWFQPAWYYKPVAGLISFHFTFSMTFKEKRPKVSMAPNLGTLKSQQQHPQAVLLSRFLAISPNTHLHNPWTHTKSISGFPTPAEAPWNQGTENPKGSPLCGMHLHCRTAHGRRGPQQTGWEGQLGKGPRWAIWGPRPQSLPRTNLCQHLQKRKGKKLLVVFESSEGQWGTSIFSKRTYTDLVDLCLIKYLTLTHGRNAQFLYSLPVIWGYSEFLCLERTFPVGGFKPFASITVAMAWYHARKGCKIKQFLNH